MLNDHWDSNESVNKNSIDSTTSKRNVATENDTVQHCPCCKNYGPDDKRPLRELLSIYDTHGPIFTKSPRPKRKQIPNQPSQQRYRRLSSESTSTGYECDDERQPDGAIFRFDSDQSHTDVSESDEEVAKKNPKIVGHIAAYQNIMQKSYKSAISIPAENATSAIISDKSPNFQPEELMYDFHINRIGCSVCRMNDTRPTISSKNDEQKAKLKELEICPQTPIVIEQDLPNPKFDKQGAIFELLIEASASNSDTIKRKGTSRHSKVSINSDFSVSRVSRADSELDNEVFYCEHFDSDSLDFSRTYNKNSSGERSSYFEPFIVETDTDNITSIRIMAEPDVVRQINPVVQREREETPMFEQREFKIGVSVRDSKDLPTKSIESLVNMFEQKISDSTSDYKLGAYNRRLGKIQPTPEQDRAVIVDALPKHPQSFVSNLNRRFVEHDYARNSYADAEPSRMETEWFESGTQVHRSIAEDLAEQTANPLDDPSFKSELTEEKRVQQVNGAERPCETEESQDDTKTLDTEDVKMITEKENVKWSLGSSKYTECKLPKKNVNGTFPTNIKMMCSEDYEVMTVSKPIIYDPTVKPYARFTSVDDVMALRKAMKGLGTDEKMLISIICKRSNAQLKEIQCRYTIQLGRVLYTDVRSETSGNFREVLCALLVPRSMFYANQLRNIISGLVTDIDSLIEILCALSHTELTIVQETYLCIYNRTLVGDITSTTSGLLRSLLVSMCVAHRDESTINTNLVLQDARDILAWPKKRIGVDEYLFNQILTQRSFAHIRAINQSCIDQENIPLFDIIQQKFKGDLKNALSMIVMLALDHLYFFASRFYKSMAGLGTNDSQLIRLMVMRCEIDLAAIAIVFQRAYGKTLASFIQGDTSGDYRHALLAILGVE